MTEMGQIPSLATDWAKGSIAPTPAVRVTTSGRLKSTPKPRSCPWCEADNPAGRRKPALRFGGLRRREERITVRGPARSRCGLSRHAGAEQAFVEALPAPRDDCVTGRDADFVFEDLRQRVAG